MSLYKEKYRVESSRLRNWDYASDGYYYLTICTINRMFYFGDIINNQMILSKIGKTAYQYWQEIPNHFPFVQLDQFVIMPNHMHGIIVINNHHTNTHGPEEMQPPVEMQDLASLPTKTTEISTKLTETNNKFGRNPEIREI